MRAMTWGILVLAAMTAGGLAACSASSSGTPLTPTGSGGTAAAGATGGLGGASFDGGGLGGLDGGNLDGQADACAAEVAEATVVVRPVDIIFVIDNSSSMSEESQSVEANINDSFATIIGASNIDYRVIMITNHGTGPYDVCVEAPLSTLSSGSCSGAPGNNPPRFYHYSNDVQSWDALCKILDTFNNSQALKGSSEEEFGQVLNGYQEWLRPEAFKFFVVITDDAINCVTSPYHPNPNVASRSFAVFDDVAGGQVMAEDWDRALLALSPLHFGNSNKRNYRMHSIIGVTEKPVPTDPYLSTEPIATQKCSSAVNTATGYQWLSKATGGLRFAVCLADNPPGYQPVFQEIALGVVEGASAPCEYEMPEPPPGETINPDTLEVRYTPGSTGTPENFGQVADLAHCGSDDDKFYVEGDIIMLCPGACARVESDDDAQVEILIGCGTPPPR